MKTLTTKLGLFLGLISLVSGAPSIAKEKVTHPMRVTDARDSGPSNTRFGFGFASYGGVTSLGAALGIAPAMDGWIEIGNMSSLQLLASIASTNPFYFSLGGVFRYNLVGDQSAGAHAGLGLNMGLGTPTATAAATGSTSSYFLNIFPVVGFHFGLGGAASNVVLSFDGGPAFAVTPNFQFTLGPNSWILGGAINYML